MKLSLLVLFQLKNKRPERSDEPEKDFDQDEIENCVEGIPTIERFVATKNTVCKASIVISEPR